MTKDEIVQYIANVALISAVDGKLSPLEAQAIEKIRNEIGATESDLHTALSATVQKGGGLKPVGRFSDKVRNLEDMIFVSLADQDFAKSEKSEVLSFAKTIKITQDQLTEILAEAKLRAAKEKVRIECKACAKDMPADSKFCPHCGAKI